MGRLSRGNSGGAQFYGGFQCTDNPAYQHVWRYHFHCLRLFIEFKSADHYPEHFYYLYPVLLSVY